ncbi:MAG: DUF2851 family protein [Bacteroidota bacterium]
MVLRNDSLMIPERFLRQLWKFKYFDTSALKTTDGRTLEIFSTGTVNHDGGPDFINARLRIGGILYRGDIELHKSVKEWNEHEHHLDPKYNSVILHVILHGKDSGVPHTTQSNRVIPVLILENYLTSSYHSLWEKMILGERAERLNAIKCFPVNDSVPPTYLRNWLDKLAIERLELKVRRFEDRLIELIEERQSKHVKEDIPSYREIPFGLNPEQLPSPGEVYSESDFRQSGPWEQLLYEGILEALGYSKNQQPFLKLSRNISLQKISKTLKDVKTNNPTLFIESILFGAAGLLPTHHSFPEKATALRVNQMRTMWDKNQKLIGKESLNQAEWQFFRLRPENFPTIRIAGAARLITRMLKEDFLKLMIQITKRRDIAPLEKLHQFESLLITSSDDYWKTHYRFGEESSQPLSKLIGKNRAAEIILNVFFPISLLYARIFKDKEVRQSVLDMFTSCPPHSENTIVRTIGAQLLKQKFTMDSAKDQQGALQLYKLYCLEERCSECAVGKEVFKVEL